MTDTEPTPPLPDSWADDDREAARKAGKGRIILIVVGIAAVVILGALAFVVISTHDTRERAWPATVNGRPDGLGGERETTADVNLAADPGVYIWSGFDGWHLWVVNGGDLKGIKGTITSNAEISRGAPSAPGDGTATVKGKELTFDLSGDAPLAGVDFEPGLSKHLEFQIEGPDGPIDASVVTTGRSGTAVAALPFVIDKHVVEKS
ncbi:hypothetical protein [Aquihabitans sp. McL0605]|uniref:hypothetical protein n=1 Tax=Aquihabitans sp. McL0605 TaxID=3415671 RepID=UPI003CF45E36